MNRTKLVGPPGNSAVGTSELAVKLIPEKLRKPAALA